VMTETGFFRNCLRNLFHGKDTAPNSRSSI
jgi:hypothetical protein